MDSDQQLQVHITIQKGFSIPPLHKCDNCCFPSRVHCPFCLPAFFKPTKRSRAMLHMNNHLRRAIYVGEYTIHRCGLACRKLKHYHCLYCTATLIRKRDFSNHLPFCREAQQQKNQQLSQPQAALTQRVQVKGFNAQSLTWGEDDILSSDIESDDDSDHITIISDSDDQNSQGESSSFIPKAIEYDTVDKMKSSSKTKMSKFCHRAAQTNIDKPQDCDEYYFMSLVKMFKKLSPQKKADVRMKIERLLFEAECE